MGDRTAVVSYDAAANLRRFRKSDVQLRVGLRDVAVRHVSTQAARSVREQGVLSSPSIPSMRYRPSASVRNVASVLVQICASAMGLPSSAASTLPRNRAARFHAYVVRRRTSFTIEKDGPAMFRVNIAPVLASAGRNVPLPPRASGIRNVHRRRLPHHDWSRGSIVSPRRPHTGAGAGRPSEA